MKTNELSTADGVSGSKPSFKSSTGGFVIDSVLNDLVIAGEIRAFTGSIIPDGWLACEGQLLNINDYLELFNAIGVTYGGNGQTTFALPDLRDRVVTGASETTPLGMYGGENNRVLSLSNLPEHDHIASLRVSLDNGQQYNPISDGYLGAVALSGPGTKQNLYTSTAIVGTATLNNNSVTVLPTGDSQAFDNRSAYVSVSYIIATRSLNSLSIRDTTAIHKSGNEIATGNKTFQRITTDSLWFKQASLFAPGYLNFGIKKKSSGLGIYGTEFRWMTPAGGLGDAINALNLQYQSNADTGINKTYRTLFSLKGSKVDLSNYAQLYGGTLDVVDKINPVNGSRLGGNINATRGITLGLSGALSRPVSQGNTSGYIIFTDSLTKNLVLLSGGSSYQYELALDKNSITANRTVTFPDKSGTLAMLDDIAADSNIVHKTGDETISGNKTFYDGLRVNSSINPGYFSIVQPGEIRTNNDTGDSGYISAAQIYVQDATKRVSLDKTRITFNNSGWSLAILAPTLTAGRTITFPDASGTIALTSDLSAKQDILISGTTVRTINGTSLLGSGDITISGSGGIAGSGITGSLAKWSGSSGLTDAVAGTDYLTPTTIKTINGNSLLESGDITISGGLNSAATDSLNSKLSKLFFGGQGDTYMYAKEALPVEFKIFNNSETVPSGWVKFDSGALLSISTHPNLFNFFGTTYGGNGQTNFALPGKSTFDLTNAVHKTGFESISGDKFWTGNNTFSNGIKMYDQTAGGELTLTHNATSNRSIAFPNASGTVALTSDLIGKPNDSEVVHKTGDETVLGNKTIQRVTTDSLMFNMVSGNDKFMYFGGFKSGLSPNIQRYKWGYGPNGLIPIVRRNLTLWGQSPNDAVDTTWKPIVRFDTGGASFTGNVYANSISGKLFDIHSIGNISRPIGISGSYHRIFTDSISHNLVISSGSNAKELLLSKSLFTANRTITFPDKSGTLALMSDFSLKQDVLISGTSIKTINGNSLLGGGDLNLTPSFGSSAGTVTEGNDSRVLNGQTAFTWGNHSTAGYASNTGVVHNTGNEVIAGTKTFSDKVGIGVASPGNYQLAVKGTIRTQAIKVDPSNWADYVFAKSYKLPLLSAVEKFIKEKQRLPEIPSEAEVKKNGIELGEMNALLLKKIEELTLYMIEKDKEVKELKTRLDILEKKK